MLQDAAGILTAAPPKTYPALEAIWLITCAWNRGATHAKFSRAEEAKTFVNLALVMADSPAMEGIFVEEKVCVCFVGPFRGSLWKKRRGMIW